MRGHDFAWRMNLFAVACGVRGDLCGLLPGAACALQILANLLAARAGCVEVLLRVAFDFRRAAAANGDLVTELAKPVSQLRLIDGGGKLLRCEEALRLDGAGLAVVALGDIEDDGVGMELRRNVTIDRAGGVVLEFGGDEFGRRFGRMVAADAGLRVHFKLLQGDANALAVGHADVLIAANERGERDGFGRGKCRIPTGAVLHGLDGFAVCILVFIGGALANKLLASRRMLALAELGKVLGGDRSGKAELRGKPALPFAGNHAALGPIVLLLGGELLCVVALRLPCGKRLGNGQHGCLLQLMSGRLDLMLRELRLPCICFRLCRERRAWHDQIVHLSLIEAGALLFERNERK